MNTQSISPALSLSQSFLMNFGPAQQPHKNEAVNNNQNIPQKKLTEDSYKPSKPVASNNATPVNTSMQKPDASFSRSESINLKFTTKEGDVVTINFKRTETRGSNAGNKDHINAAQSNKQQSLPSTNPNQNTEVNANKAKQQALPDTQKNKNTQVASNQNQQPTKAPVNSTPQAIVDNPKVVATPAKATQVEKQKTTPPVDQQKTTPNNQSKVSTGSNKLTASRRSEFQLEQGNNKFSGSKEEKYALESANNSNKQSAPAEPIKNTQSQPPVSVEKKPTPVAMEKPQAPVSTKPSEKQQSITNEASPVPTSNSIANGSNTIHMEQSVNKVGSDGKSQSFNSEFSLNIEGDLNDAERESITNLMQAMSQISQGFFEGGASNAFSHAQNMGLETEQIASFSMDGNKQQSVQAVSAYQQTAMPEKKVDTGLISEASEFLSEAKGMMPEAGTAVKSFDKPEQSFTDMFANVGQMFLNTQDTGKENNSGDMFLKMIENISGDLFGRNQTA